MTPFERGVRAGLEAAAEMAGAFCEASAAELEKATAPPDIVSKAIVRVLGNVASGLEVAIRSLDPATVKDTGDGRE